MKREFVRKCFSMLMVMTLVLSLFPTAVFAQGESNNSIIDFTKTGSLTITKYDGDKGDTTKPVSGVAYSLYQVLTLSQGESSEVIYEFTPEFKPFFDLKGIKVEDILEADASFLTDLQSELVTYIDGNGTHSTYTQETTEEGTVIFNDLALAYYLVRETKLPDSVVSEPMSFFVSIPMTSIDGSQWQYDIVAKPKGQTANTELTLVKMGQEGSQDAVFLAGAEFKLEKENNGEFEIITTITTNETGKHVFKELTQGKYRLTETKAPEGYILDQNNVIEFTVSYVNGQLVVLNTEGHEFENLTIKVVNEKPAIEKTLGDNSMVTDAAIGSIVEWKITVDVPTIINQLETFTVTDTLSHGLTFKENSVNVKLDEKELVAGTHYTFKQDGQELTFDFNPATLSSGQLVMTYETTLNEGAIVGNTGNPNHVELEYSTNPDSTSTLKPVSPVVFTFGLKIMKEDTSNKPLAGAEFDLYDAKGTKLNKESLVSLNDGTIQVDGLAIGDYYLVETKAPEGFNLLKQPIKFSITAEFGSDADGTIEITQTNTVDGYVELTVVNKKGFELPETGGIGTLIFTVSGLALMIVASGAYFVSKRKTTK